jgi:hypothetical protein
MKQTCKSCGKKKMFIGTIQTEGLNMRGGMPTIIMSPDELMWVYYPID